MGNNNYEVRCDEKTAYVLTEQEHLKSCDATFMLKSIARGEQIRTQQTAPYGEENYFASKSELLLKKQEIEKNLTQFAQDEKIDHQDLKKNPYEAITKHLRKKNAQSASPTPKVADKQPDPLETQQQKTAQNKNDQTIQNQQ